MEHDYYSILGVGPATDLDAIKKAFRQRVRECHPDRGGSHDQMVLVNEAWEVLSDPTLRRRYDEARTNAGDRAAQETAAADARQARQRAEQYPRRWEEFEKWLNAVAADFTRAEYGSVPLHQDVHLPTAGNSLSGWLFILIGAVLAGVFVSPMVYGFLEKTRIGFKANGSPNIFGFAFVVLPIIGGAWAGAGAHLCISFLLQSFQEQSARATQRAREREARRARQGQPAGAPPESRVLCCERCGQKLRVPVMPSELLVTCRSCGHKFTCLPVDRT